MGPGWLSEGGLARGHTAGPVRAEQERVGGSLSRGALGSSRGCSGLPLNPSLEQDPGPVISPPPAQPPPGGPAPPRPRPAPCPAPAHSGGFFPAPATCCRHTSSKGPGR